MVAKCGDVDEGFRNSAHIIEGEAKMDGQLHFYMETHQALAVPKDGEEMELFASVQSPSILQVGTCIILLKNIQNSGYHTSDSVDSVGR